MALDLLGEGGLPQAALQAILKEASLRDGFCMVSHGSTPMLHTKTDARFLGSSGVDDISWQLFLIVFICIFIYIVSYNIM